MYQNKSLESNSQQTVIAIQPAVKFSTMAMELVIVRNYGAEPIRYHRDHVEVVGRLLKTGMDKVRCIKLYRSISGRSLMDAKVLIDSLEIIDFDVS